MDIDVKHALIKEMGGRCMACGTKERLALDHVLPLNKGGMDHVSNLQVLCVQDNVSKGNRTMDFRTNTDYIPKKKCLRCGYSWCSVIDPKSCPRCKQRKWKTKSRFA